MTVHRLALLRTIKVHPGPIAAIAERLARPADAIQRDVDELETFGLIQTTQRELRLSADRFKLDATLA